MRNQFLFLSVVITLWGSVSLYSYAANDHGESDGHSSEQAEEAKGSHGGKLLSDGDFSLELKIFETGVPPEMRLYAYDNGKPIASDNWQANVTLDRLGGDKDQIKFSSSWRSLIVVRPSWLSNCHS